MDWISIALSVVGVVGIGGGLALFFLAPAAFAVVATQAEKIIAATLSTRIGCAVLAGGLCFIAADQYRSAVSASECTQRIELAHELAEEAAKERDADIRKQVEAEQAPIMDQLRKQAEEALGEALRYEKERLAAVAAGGNACLLDSGALKLRQRTEKPPGAPRRRPLRPGSV